MREMLKSVRPKDSNWRKLWPTKPGNDTGTAGSNTVSEVESPTTFRPTSWAAPTTFPPAPAPIASPPFSAADYGPGPGAPNNYGPGPGAPNHYAPALGAPTNFSPGLITPSQIASIPFAAQSHDVAPIPVATAYTPTPSQTAPVGSTPFATPSHDVARVQFARLSLSSTPIPRQNQTIPTASALFLPPGHDAAPVPVAPTPILPQNVAPNFFAPSRVPTSAFVPIALTEAPVEVPGSPVSSAFTFQPVQRPLSTFDPAHFGPPLDVRVLKSQLLKITLPDGDGASYYVHEELIGSVSPELRKQYQVNNELGEGLLGELVLREVEEAVFICFLQWAYGRDYMVNPETGPLLYVKIYIFSEQYNITYLGNITFDKLTAFLEAELEQYQQLLVSGSRALGKAVVQATVHAAEYLPISDRVVDALLRYISRAIHSVRELPEFNEMIQSNPEVAIALVNAMSGAAAP
ncbi:hypothetical protein BDZ91DRAFT_749593 [Kalaharituber pfeilii]|nr:hypothetical protein BDZ91DRAFT_749593 [Kalaharituber pfeilii]